MSLDTKILNNKEILDAVKAEDQAHELNLKYKLNRFNTGHLIDEKGVGTKTWIG